MIEIPGYKILNPIGHGGMATVYLANQESVGRKVAIKVMAASLAADPNFHERFVKEARMGSLSHPNIIIVYDADIVNGQNYIVMEYVSGGNLDKLIKNHLSIKRTIEIISQIASALNYAYEQGYIHRDVKPENILIRQDGTAVLTDFGIAKAISSGTQLTTVGSTIGSPNYMSPEQARGLALDGRSDLYSLGIVLFEALTGKKPFDAPDTFVIGLKHINDPIPQLPSHLFLFQPIIDKLLAKSADDRFENGQQLIQAFTEINAENIDPKPIVKSVVHPKNFHEAPTQLKDNFHSIDTINASSIETMVSNAHETETRVIENETQQREISQDATRVLSDENITYKNLPVDETIVLPASEISKKNHSIFLKVSILLLCVVSASSIFYYVNELEDTIPPIDGQTSSIDSVSDKIIDKPSEKSPLTIKTENAPVQTTLPSKTKAPESEELSVSSEPEITQIQMWLEKADELIQKKRFTSPKNENAYVYLSKVLNEDRNNQQALEGLSTILNFYYIAAKKRFEQKSFQNALAMINRGLKVKSDDSKLLALKDKIQVSQNRSTLSKIFFQPDQKFIKLTGIHKSNNKTERNKYARIDLSNKIYNELYGQCIKNNSVFTSSNCTALYERVLKQISFPLFDFSNSQIANDDPTRIVFKAEVLKKLIENFINPINDNLIFSETTEENYSTRISQLANYQLLKPIADILNIPTLSVADNDYLLAQKFAASNSPNITIDEFTKNVKKRYPEQTFYLKPIINHDSYEITPFAATLRKSLQNKLPTNSHLKANITIHSEILNSNDNKTKLIFYFINNNHKILDISYHWINTNQLTKKRNTPLLSNDAIFPKKEFEGNFSFNSDLLLGEQNNNAELKIGNSASLKVKLDKAGFYFIAVHVLNQKEQYSYLLPLSEEDVPFIQSVSNKNTQKFLHLGSFTITPPAGVEILQLIASNVNLLKFLPNYELNKTQKKHIILGSENNIKRGIELVRENANQITETSHTPNASWFEKLLVTSIIQK